MRIRTALIAAALLALAAAAPASAAPDRTANMALSQTFEWQGEATTSISGQFWWTGDPAADCHTFDFGAGSVGAIDHCDQTLVSLPKAGRLVVTLPSAGDGLVTDWDLYVFTADEDGAAGDLLGESENIGGAEEVAVDEAEGGHYLAVAVPYQAVNEGFAGAAYFTPAE